MSPDDSPDSESTTGMTQSSKTWALYSKAKAAESAERADATIGADEEAETYAQDAKTYMAAAKKAVADATTQAAAASASEKAALTSETNAASSASAAKASENAARESEKNADSRAQDAESAANSAKGYAASALGDKTASGSAANTAKTYAETATREATAAGDSQTAAAHSASSAKASADHAGESATIAADNVATATTCAAQASNARDAAIGAKDGAEAAQANAKASATAATNSAASAQESAEKAKGYATVTNPVTSVKEDTAKGGIVVTNATGDETVIPLAAPDLTPYMKKTADSDLAMGTDTLSFNIGKIYPGFIDGGRSPTLTIETKNVKGLNIIAPNVYRDGSYMPTSSEVSTIVMSAFKSKNPVTSVTESGGVVTVQKVDGTQNTFNGGLNILTRSKAYAVGDIAYSPNLPSWAYLECTTAGTTGASEPDFSGVKSGGVILDDTAKFTIMTVCSKEYVDALGGSSGESDKVVEVPIENLTDNEIVNVTCYKSGHVVTVQFSVLKAINVSENDVRENTAKLKGFPKPVFDKVWVHCIPMGGGDHLLGMLKDEYFGWFYAQFDSGGNPAVCTCTFTYLTNE